MQAQQQIKLGDYVKVIVPGSIYSTYDTAAKNMGLTKFKYGYSMIDPDKLYLVMNDYRHPTLGHRILGITDSMYDLVIREDGVELAIISKDREEGKPIERPKIIFDITNLDLCEETSQESENEEMTENLNEMVASGTDQAGAEGAPAASVEEIATEANQLVADAILAETVKFCETLSGDVKVVSHGNNTSIKFKNKNFVYLTRNKKKSPPLKVQVKQGKEWPVITLDAQAGFEGLKQVIQTAFNEVQG